MTIELTSNLLLHRIQAVAAPFDDVDSPVFTTLFDHWASKRLVLLGEASHGTAEFYRGRAAITRHLVQNHEFRVIATEADWPDAAILDRYIRGRPQPANPVMPFQRFPQWMWRNQEFSELIDWLRQWNQNRPAPDQVRFYGLDMYSMGSSIKVVLDYLEQQDPQAAAIARERYGCLEPWTKEPAAYGLAVEHAGYRACEEAVIRQCRELLDRQMTVAQEGGEELLDAAQNARLVAAAERYYRTMYRGGASSWNLRDSHMAETLDLVLNHTPAPAKAIVWAHNSHIGDARFSEMGRTRQEHNLGQLCRQHWPEETALIGFGTDTGQVAAATDWGGAMEIKTVRPSHPDSFEHLCHISEIPRFLLDFSRDTFLSDSLAQTYPQRFIGVIYRPESELMSHYMEAEPSRQYDGWVWFDKTHAVTPGVRLPNRGAADTWPFGL